MVLHLLAVIPDARSAIRNRFGWQVPAEADTD
jgi:hypothetical protein